MKNDLTKDRKIQPTNKAMVISITVASVIAALAVISIILAFVGPLVSAIVGLVATSGLIAMNIIELTRPNNTIKVKDSPTQSYKQESKVTA